MPLHFAWLARNVKIFHPSCFVMVMATGIVSITFDLLSFRNIAEPLFILNLLLYSVFCTLFVAKILFYPRNLLAELRVLSQSWLFLAFVAGTNTVGVQLILFFQMNGLVSVLWCGALLVWLICLGFIVFNILKTREKVINSTSGATLLLTVSTASIVLPGNYLLDMVDVAMWRYWVLWGIWLLSCMLYLYVIYLIIHRLSLEHFAPENWQPAYWICMGALAIITLAGAEFLMHLPRASGLEQITLVISLVAWTLGTLWIPYLLVMDIRKFTRGLAPDDVWMKLFPWVRLACRGKYCVYSIDAWSRVFPAGMYAACTFSLAKASGYSFLESISLFWCWFALLVWLCTFVGALGALRDKLPIDLP